MRQQTAILQLLPSNGEASLFRRNAVMDQDLEQSCEKDVLTFSWPIPPSSAAILVWVV